MEEVKNIAKWWNSEVGVPNLSTSLCIVSGPGALPLLRNLTNLMRVWAPGALPYWVISGMCGQNGGVFQAKNLRMGVNF